MKKKIVAFILVFALALALGIGGTMAWLTDQKTVTNTFTFGDINIELTETDVDGKTVTSKTFDSLVPGEIVAKDPKVTVVAGSEKCYIFVRIEEDNNTAESGKYIDWNVDTDNWTPVEGETGVYKYNAVVDAADGEQSLYVLQRGEKDSAYENGYVTVNGDNVTKDYVDDLTEDTYPALTITAYAVQYAGFETDVAGAWAKVDPTPAP